MNKAILYSFRRCPYAIRARLALSYANIDYEHREILLKDKPQSMLDYSVKGTVPILITDNKVIDESLQVMLWALKYSDADGWLNNDKQFELIEMCDNKFKAQLDCYKYSDRHVLTEIEYRDQALWFLQLLEHKLSKHQFLFGDKLSMADMAIFPFIRQFAFVQKQWFDDSEYVQLQSWLQDHLQSHLFVGIMKKHKLWKNNN